MGKRIKSLSESQAQLQARVYNDALAVGRSTTPINQPLVEAAITGIYARLELAAPRFVKLASPAACIRELRRLGHAEAGVAGALCGGGWASVWVLAEFAKQIGVGFKADDSEHHALWYAQWREAHWWWPYKRLVMLSERPTVCKVDTDGKLHCSDGPAIEYGDGYKLFAWHGLRAPVGCEPSRWLEWESLKPALDHG